MSDVPPQPPYDPYGSQPPPPGSYPPPGGYPPPGAYPPPGGYPPPPGGFPLPEVPGNLAEWPQRALGYVIDWGPLFVLSIIGLFLPVGIRLLIDLVEFGWAIFLAVQLGQSGSTPGMRVAGLRAVNKTSGQPIGAGMGILRAICHIIDTFACLLPGWLILPLVTKQKGTIADLIVGSYVLTVPKQAFSLTPTP